MGDWLRRVWCRWRHRGAQEVVWEGVICYWACARCGRMLGDAEVRTYRFQRRKEA